MDHYQRRKLGNKKNSPSGSQNIDDEQSPPLVEYLHLASSCGQRRRRQVVPNSMLYFEVLSEKIDDRQLR
jgi:hypothetical protein